MENDLYRFIADRDTPIMDNIERYCISNNKNKLDIVRVVFDFLLTVKTRLDEAFVDVCMSHILSNATENEKRAFYKPYLDMVRLNDYNSEYNEIVKSHLKRIEGGHGNITELMFYAINSKERESEKVIKLLDMPMFAKNKLYMLLLAGIYTSEETGVEIGYIDNLGNTISHTYSRGEFIMDYDIVDEVYIELCEDLGATEITEIENRKTLLDTEGADVYINRAIELGIITNTSGGLKWNKTKTLLSYFAEKISVIINLSNVVDKDGDIKVNWKITENTFNVKNLKGAKNDYMKSKTKFKPQGHEEIDNIFK